jgi:hypothetical protein
VLKNERKMFDATLRRGVYSIMFVFHVLTSMIYVINYVLKVMYLSVFDYFIIATICCIVMKMDLVVSLNSDCAMGNIVYSGLVQLKREI